MPGKAKSSTKSPQDRTESRASKILKNQETAKPSAFKGSSAKNYMKANPDTKKLRSSKREVKWIPNPITTKKPTILLNLTYHKLTNPSKYIQPS
jgi:hypothetical protein